MTASVPPTIVESSTALAVEDSTRSAVTLDHVSKVYGTQGNSLHALDNITIDVEKGEFLCLLGASGCGKSTLLNIIAGIDRPSAGTVSTGTNRTTLMFQESALFPWLTARGNVELPLKIRKVPRGAAAPEGRRAPRAGQPERVRRQAAP